MRIDVTGADGVNLHLARLQEGFRAARATVVTVGSPLKYAYGIEFGRHRGGGLARRAGGAFYLTGALRAVLPRIAPALAKALPQGGPATRAALLRLGYQIQAGAQATVPVKTGTLRRSLHTVAEAR